MQRGTCFINYEDFKECFRTFKKETRSSFSIESSITVQNHNAEYGTSIREDIIFAQVKFCCCKLEGYNSKRRCQEVVCPAYFFMEYDKTLDRLVVKEASLTHVHTKKTKLQQQQSSPSLSSEIPKHEADSLIPSKKKCLAGSLPQDQDDSPLDALSHSHAERANLQESSPDVSMEILKDEVATDVSSEKKCNTGSPAPDKDNVPLDAPTHNYNRKLDEPLLNKMLTHQQTGSEILPKKKCGDTVAPPPDEGGHIDAFTDSDKDLDEEGQLEIDTTSNRVREVLSIDAISKLGELLKVFQTKDVGAKALLSIGSQQNLDQISFQTSKMCALFLKFPESLLIHMVTSKFGYTLYAFLVENKERVGKVVNFTFVRENNLKEIFKMLQTFKNFNPEWQKVKIIYTDIYFKYTDALKEAFPSATHLISVFHTVSLIKKKTKGTGYYQEWLYKWIDDAIYNTTQEKLSYLASKIQDKLDEELFNKLSKNWFSCNLLWYMHVKKGLHSCFSYMDSLSLAIDTISGLLLKQTSTEEQIRQFVEFADSFNNKADRNKALDLQLNIQGKNRKVKTKRAHASHHLTLKRVTGSPRRIQPLIKPPQETTLNMGMFTHKSKPANVITPKVKQHAADEMLKSMRLCCNDLAFKLCSKEWEVVQKSSQLISVQTNCVLVQFLEESHMVPNDGSYCSCYFNTHYRLPCRHILSMLIATKKPVSKDMVCPKWLKNHVEPVRQGNLKNTIVVQSKTPAEANKRAELINSLAMELSNLLLQCEGAEMKVRASTLEMIVDMWHKDSQAKPSLGQPNNNDLPCKWVLKESIKEEENVGSYELYRLDTCPAIS